MPELRPLLTVLGDLALIRPGIVMMQGRNYWLVEKLLAQAREDLDVPELERALQAPTYWWDEDEHGKAVIWRSVKGQEEAVFAEAGSDIRMG